MNDKIDQELALGAPCRALEMGGSAVVLSCRGLTKKSTSCLVAHSMLLIVLEGTLRFRHGGTQYSINAREMALLKKGIFIECFSSLSAAGDANYILIWLTDDLLREFVRVAPLTVPRPKTVFPVTKGPVDVRFVRFLNALESYISESINVNDQLTRIKLFEFLFSLVQVNKEITSQLMDFPSHFRTDITATVEDNITNAITLPKLAVLAGRSLSSFKRDFTAIYNMPPSAWMRQRRLEKAQELLKHTTMNVTDVCYTLGFQNLAHFSRLFKAHFGFPPSTLKDADRRSGRGGLRTLDRHNKSCNSTLMK